MATQIMITGMLHIFKLFKDVIMPSSAHQLLMAGVTSARDLGGPLGGEFRC